ncbi:MAG: M23 family metallopeptidase [Geobacteraceae bacterium]|nr:M23 family metallopeptidase [Geobacteraceae bacterium]NTW80126.1 M23 family metallopeptidase [Geobacteraceae bacterium]
MNPEKVLAICVLLCFCLSPSILPAATATDLNELPTVAKTAALSRTTQTNQLCSEFNEFNNLIRDGLISKSAARPELSIKLAGLRAEYYQRGGRDYPAAQWFFPVAGYGSWAIEKVRNHGFITNGYDYFSGNRHGGHPAYDIFIRDHNQDSRDDLSGTEVGVLSMTGGIVLALEKVWQNGSKLRGGKYIWVYDPANNLLVYYAHNDKLFVELGSIVKPGDLLSTVGRSGYNAAKRRSPTHLHLSALKLKNGKPVPVPVYRELRLARCAITQ